MKTHPLNVVGLVLGLTIATIAIRHGSTRSAVSHHPLPSDVAQLAQHSHANGLHTGP
jgi:hypothetical protein